MPSSSVIMCERTRSFTIVPRVSPPCLRQAVWGGGDRVALLLHNRIEFVEALLACHRLAAVAVPINFRLAPDEIDYVLADSGRIRAGSRRRSPSWWGADTRLAAALPSAIA
jgi:AMP-binding enzyme